MPCWFQEAPAGLRVEAKLHRKGVLLWAEDDPMPPWEWRRR